MANVLVDTSVWVKHFRESNQELIHLLERDAVLMHPLIIAEIGCGTPPTRTRTLLDLSALQQAQQPNLTEVMDFINEEKLYGQGCGIIDMILLASALITSDTKLWTLDKRLSLIAKKFGVMHRSTLH